MMLGVPPDGSSHIDISDPTSDEFYHYFRDVAKKNTLIFEEVFATIPSDRVRNFTEVGPYTEGKKLKDSDPQAVNTSFLLCNSISFSSKAHEKLKGVQGFVVEYPLYFLDDENYLPSIRTREGEKRLFAVQCVSSSFVLGLVPHAMWT